MDSSALFHSPTVFLGEFLSDLIQASFFAANIKDARTGKFRESNAYESQIAGLNPDEYNRLDIHDVGNILNLEKSLIEKVVQIDQKVITSAASQHFLQAILEKSGFIRIGNNLKLPIFDNHQREKVIAIFSYSYDITAQYSVECLFELYKKYYSIKEAILFLLKYLKIDHLFFKLPTYRELLTLLTMRRNASSKYVSRKINISSRTVDEYKVRLRHKLKMMALDDLLVLLRVQNEQQFSY